MQAAILLPIFIIFFAVKAETEDEIFCAQGISGCYVSGEISFPENDEAMDLACEKAITYLNCMERLLRICPDRDAFREREIGKLLRKLHVLCDEDSEIHKALAQDIGCIKDIFLNFNVTCLRRAVEISDLAGYKDFMEDKEHFKFLCLYRMAEISCLLTKTGDLCGTLTEKAFLDVVKVMEEKDEYCPESAFQEAEKLIQTLDIEEDMKIRFKKLREVIQ